MSSEESTAESSHGELVPVVLLDYPIDVWSRASDESRDLTREFTLIVLNEGREQTDIPARLVELSEELQATYGSLGTAQSAALEQARADGVVSIDRLVFPLPRGIGRDVDRLARMMDEADEYCRRGEHLLSLASTPASKAFRDWFFDEIVRQLDGEAPTPWPASKYAAIARGSAT